jgi:hypothetical protein
MKITRQPAHGADTVAARPEKDPRDRAEHIQKTEFFPIREMDRSVWLPAPWAIEVSPSASAVVAAGRGCNEEQQLNPA